MRSASLILFGMGIAVFAILILAVLDDEYQRTNCQQVHNVYECVKVDSYYRPDTRD